MIKVSAAFVKAQKEFSPALKTSVNPHFKSKYADLSSCVEAVIDALNNNGIALLQKTHEDRKGVIVETIFVHESGETLSAGTLFVPSPKNDPHGYGSALTYARRYSLMAACGIAPEDDDGNAAIKATHKPKDVVKEDTYEDYQKAHKDSMHNSAKKGTEHLKKAFANLPASQWKAKFWEDSKDFLKVIAEKADSGVIK